jgi:hypothetical protein
VRRITGTALAALTALAIWVPAASATFHLIQVREVYPGSVANPGSEYVELQMWAADQNFVAGHILRTYNAAGAVAGSDAFPAEVPRGADQSTLVLATPAAEAEFGFTADAPLASSSLDPGGGAVCWESIDCVSWGALSGSLPSPAGSPATPAGIPDGMALRRAIAAGCATLLEPIDDRDNSAADFSAVFPAPRPNSVAPSERPCGGAAGGGGGPAVSAHDAPQTVLKGKPPRRSRDRTPTFRFAADEAGAGFECSLDRRRFSRCRSPFTAKPLSTGAHRFRVRARDGSSLVDPSPASYAFRVLPRRRVSGL